MEGIQHFIDTFFDLRLIGETLRSLLSEGLFNTVFLAVLASLIGLVVGVFVAGGLMSSRR